MASLSLLRLAPRSSTRVVCSACGARGARIAAVDIAVLGDYPVCATPFSFFFFFFLILVVSSSLFSMRSVGSTVTSSSSSPAVLIFHCRSSVRTLLLVFLLRLLCFP